MCHIFSHSSSVNQVCFCSGRVVFKIQQDCIIKENLKPFNWLLVDQVVKIAVLIVNQGKQTVLLIALDSLVSFVL